MDAAMAHQQLTDIGCNYPIEAIAIALVRGYDHEAHIDALLSMNDDLIGISHPINLLTEEESERYFFDAQS